MQADRLASIALLAILTVLYLLTLNFPPEAAMYPRGIIAFTALLTVIMLIKPGSGKVNIRSFIPNLRQNWTVITVALMIAVFIFLIEQLGLYLSLPLFVAAVMFNLGSREIKNLITVPVTLTLIVYLVFTIILKVPVPMGLLK